MQLNGAPQFTQPLSKAYSPAPKMDFDLMFLVLVGSGIMVVLFIFLITLVWSSWLEAFCKGSESQEGEMDEESMEELKDARGFFPEQGNSVGSESRRKIIILVK